MARDIAPDELAKRPPADESDSRRWTLLDCLQHILGSNTHIGREVLYVAHTGELPPEEDDALSDDRDALLNMHQEILDVTYAHVEDAEPDANLDVKWRHPAFGDLNWREWFLFIRIHSRDHAQQLQTMTEKIRQ